MIANKTITKIVAILMAVAVILCLCATIFSEQIVSAAGGLGVTMEYESKLFDTSKVLEVNILMDDADWQSLLDNAISEEYSQCDVEINGEPFYRVGIRPKGNTSLSTIVNDPNTDRYSLKLEFDQYVDGQTCYGLDKLILNNSYADATYMKEALIYDMFSYVGADASLYNYARVSVNGEYWGLYLALEAVEDSFLLRNYGTANGELYKPDSMNMGGGDHGGMPDMGDRDFGNMQRPDRNTDTSQNNGQPSATEAQRPENFQPPQPGEMPDMEDFDFTNMGGGRVGFGGGMFGGGGANLNYSDDDLDSYTTIWDGEVTGTGDGDHKRVVAALKNISQGTNLERYMDIDNLINYMAVHIFSENADSLSGSMSHNYYLYEHDGQLNLLPWDYNLAFGGMGMGRSSGATDTVNGAIDDAWNGTNFFDTLLENETYHAAYYAAMERVVDYIQNGSFDAFYTQTRNQIDTLVETDPNSFYTYEEYLVAVETLYEVVTLRGQSIQGQLDGSIPSTDSMQQRSDSLIDASHLDLSVMGSMNMGGGGFGGRGEDRGQSMQTNPSANEQPADNGGEPPEGFGNGELPEGMELPEGFDPSQFGGQMPDGFGQPGQLPENGQAETDQGQAETAGRPGMNFSDQRETSSGTLISYGIGAIVMLAAFLFALCYRRKPRNR